MDSSHSKNKRLLDSFLGLAVEGMSRCLVGAVKDR